MLPATQVIVAAAAGVVAPALAAVVPDGAGVGVDAGVGEAPAEHAEAKIAAATARAPRRRVPLTNLVSPHAGELSEQTRSLIRG